MAVLGGLIGLVGFLFLLVALIGVIAPSVFKDKKTGEVPKRSHLLLGGVTASVIAFAIAGTIAPEVEQPAAAKSAEPEQAKPEVAVTPTPAPSSVAVTAQDVREFIAELDAAIKASDAALQRGDLKSLHEHSKRMNQLKTTGERFGNSVFDAPFGYCFGAGIMAQSWWQERLTAAQKGGVESSPGVISRTWSQYKENKESCLGSTQAKKKTAETEEIASTSEDPPRKGCLKVFGIRPDGQTGTVAYTCPKK